MVRRVLFLSSGCYLGDASGGVVPGRAMMEALARHGFAAGALTGLALDHDKQAAPEAWLTGLGVPFEAAAGDAWTVDARGLRAAVPPHYRLTVGGVAVTLAPPATDREFEPGRDGYEEFMRLYDAMLTRFAPEVLAIGECGKLAREIGAMARSRGAAVVFAPEDLIDHDVAALASADAVIVSSHFAAGYLREAVGVECTVLPSLVDTGRVRSEDRDPRYLTFVNPSYEGGAYAFARVADELGQRRPDIPLLVVEGDGTEQTLADCGLDLRRHGTVSIMGHTPDPRHYWRVTRVCLVPSLRWENPPYVAVEAIANGIPVIGSNRGAIPETLGDSGVVLPLPERLTPATRSLPTAEEVAPWVEAVIRMWDEESAYLEHCQRAASEARRWDADVLEPRYVRFFQEPRPGAKAVATGSNGRSKAVVLVPHHDGVRWECETGLRQLEEAGVRVVRRAGCSAIDLGRNQLASEALHDGAETMLFIDADVGFRPTDALRLLARPEPVVAGVYAKKGQRCLASRFTDEVAEIVFGSGAPGLYPLKYAGAGFLRIRSEALRLLIERLGLPLCNLKWGRGIWPFFQPMIADDGTDGPHYLAEDWAFSRRLRQAGITPLADTSIRLWHYGHHPFSWEEAGTDRPRYATFVYRLQGPVQSEDR